MAQGSVIDPTLPVAGISQETLAEEWWAWAIGIPYPINPITDPDGSFAHANNNGPVFFIAGAFGDQNNIARATRIFDVPAGKPIFFPIINTHDFEVPGLDPQYGYDCFTETDPLACALTIINSAGMANATNLRATLDGVNLLTFPNFRQTSDSFYTYYFPANNLYSSIGAILPPPPGYLVSDGYWVALDGLSPGQHTLFFGGVSGNGFDLEVTANLNVVPEPGTFSLMLLGALAALGRRRKNLN